MSGYLDSNDKTECFGCEACGQICPKKAITFKIDKEGFRYPVIDAKKCINCGLCRRVCPKAFMPSKNGNILAYGGYHKDLTIRKKSTSGGAFSAIVDSFCKKNYVIFGATTNKTEVYHTFITDKNKLDLFRKSKYSQSIIGDSYIKVREFLNSGKNVLFSGTPCQIAGLLNFLKGTNIDNLLTVEVICEGVPSPNYIEKMNNYYKEKYNSSIKSIDYRYKEINNKKSSKWDFQVMNIVLDNGKSIVKDRWFNPFWQIWLNHLMSRPPCYKCPFTTKERCADITLGDLWGVHLYCPELYANNSGCSLILCNTLKGKKVLKGAYSYLNGHVLDFDVALKYQSPLRKHIDYNKDRDKFIKDLSNDNIGYKELIKKWYKFPTLKLLYSKYIWGNRQKVFVWNLKNGGKDERND